MQRRTLAPVLTYTPPFRSRVIEAVGHHVLHCWVMQDERAEVRAVADIHHARWPVASGWAHQGLGRCLGNERKLSGHFRRSWFAGSRSSLTFPGLLSLSSNPRHFRLAGGNQL